MRGSDASVVQKIAGDLTGAVLLVHRATAEIVLRFDFHGRVDESAGPWGCWPWQGRLSSGGYGVVRVRENGWPTSVGAHRVAYYLATGIWFDQRSQPRRAIRHLCHVRQCCNPRHLLVGSFKDNAWDDQMRRAGVDLVAVRRALGEGPFLPVVGVAW